MRCEVCGADVDDPIHRIAECPRSKEVRELTKPWIIQWLLGQGRASAAAARGLFPAHPEPLDVAPTRADSEHLFWSASGVSYAASVGAFTAFVFLDGSALLQSAPWVLRRAGWGVVEVDGTGAPVHAMWGHLPACWAQSSGASELYAFWMLASWHLARNTSVEALPATYTDYQRLLNGLEAGEAATVGEDSMLADVWEGIWRTLRALGVGVAVWPVFKVKAHTSLAECQGSDILIWRRAANSLADSYAKTGASLHYLPEPFLRAYASHLYRAREVFALAGRALALWPRPTERRDIPRLPRSLQDRGLFLRGHRPLYRNRAWCCLRCGRETVSRALLLRFQCEGPLVAAMPPCDWEGVGSHLLFQSARRRKAPVVWCFRCGAYASTRPAKLLQQCLGRPKERSRALARRDLLRRRVHPEDGDRLSRAVQLHVWRVDAIRSTWERQKAMFARTGVPAPRGAGATRRSEAGV